MHAIKGGWVGQTFALAKSNESEGRKSRIRRSKKERKAMVESFITKYQKLNNGNFPSLNLTHKEVGGSFYTVREIVRDIIQENRVLGPAKWNTEEQVTNQFLEQHPLGSIAKEPQYPLTKLSDESQFVTNNLQGTNEELSSVSGVDYDRPEHHMYDGLVVNGVLVDVKKSELGEQKHADLKEHLPVEVDQNADDKSDDEEAILVSEKMDNDELIINGSQVGVNDNESHQVTQTELLVSEPSKAEKSEEESAASRSQVTPIAADVVVETFPLRPATKSSDSLNGSLGKVSEANTSSEQDIKKQDLAAVVGSSKMDGISSLENSGSVDEKEVTQHSSLSLDKNSELLEEKVVEKHEDPLLESSNGYNPKEGTSHEVQGLADNSVDVSSNDRTSQTFEQSQVINAPNGINAKYLDSAGGMSGHSKTEREIELEVGVQQSGIPQKGNNPRLDRINLESWEGASTNSAKQKGNPLWAVFKTFVDAFVKFWSE
ncbi:hypothetical protein UlMin_026066 [Ulmus minor]